MFFFTETEIINKSESDNESDSEDDDVSNILINLMNNSNKDYDVNGHDSGNNIRYSWTSWMVVILIFLTFHLVLPYDASFLGSSCIKSE